MEKYEQTIKTVIVTLAGVKAEGPENWNRLLACDQLLKQLLADMQADAAKAE